MTNYFRFRFKMAASEGGNREKQCISRDDRLSRKEKHKGEGTNAFHVYCEHRRSGLTEPFTNEIMRLWAVDWGMLSTEERVPFFTKARQIRGAAAISMEVQINKLKRQIDKMNKLGLNCGAVVIPPAGEPSVVGQSTFISVLGADVITRLQREFQPNFGGHFQAPPELEGEVVKKLNAVAERDLGLKKFPYAGVLRGQFEVVGVPPEVLPLKKPSNYGRAKLHLLLNADLHIRKSRYVQQKSMTPSAPHLVAERRLSVPATVACAAISPAPVKHTAPALLPATPAHASLPPVNEETSVAPWPPVTELHEDIAQGVIQVAKLVTEGHANFFLSNDDKHILNPEGEDELEIDTLEVKVHPVSQSEANAVVAKLEPKVMETASVISRGEKRNWKQEDLTLIKSTFAEELSGSAPLLTKRVAQFVQQHHIPRSVNAVKDKIKQLRKEFLH